MFRTRNLSRLFLNSSSELGACTYTPGVRRGGDSQAGELAEKQPSSTVASRRWTVIDGRRDQPQPSQLLLPKIPSLGGKRLASSLICHCLVALHAKSYVNVLATPTDSSLSPGPTRRCAAWRAIRRSLTATWRTFVTVVAKVSRAESMLGSNKPGLGLGSC